MESHQPASPSSDQSGEKPDVGAADPSYTITGETIGVEDARVLAADCLDKDPSYYHTWPPLLKALCSGMAYGRVAYIAPKEEPTNRVICAATIWQVIGGRFSPRARIKYIWAAASVAAILGPRILRATTTYTSIKNWSAIVEESRTLELGWFKAAGWQAKKLIPNHFGMRDGILFTHVEVKGDVPDEG